MAFYASVQHVSNAMIHFKKDCRLMLKRSNEVLDCIEALGDDAAIRAVSIKKGKPPITHVALAKHRADAIKAAAMIEEANAMMSVVHEGLDVEAKRVGLDDHVYKKNGGGDR